MATGPVVDTNTEKRAKKHLGMAGVLGANVVSDMEDQRRPSIDGETLGVRYELKCHSTKKSLATECVYSIVMDVLKRATEKGSLEEEYEHEEGPPLALSPEPGMAEEVRMCPSPSMGNGKILLDRGAGSACPVILNQMDSMKSLSVLAVPPSARDGEGTDMRKGTSECGAMFAVEPWVSTMVTGIVEQATKRDACEGEGRGLSYSSLSVNSSDEKCNGTLFTVMRPTERPSETRTEVRGTEGMGAAAFRDGFVDIFMEAATLARKVKSRVIREEWDICRKQIHTLLQKMKAEE